MMLNDTTLLVANSIGFVIAFYACKLSNHLTDNILLIAICTTDWLGYAGLFSGGLTSFTLPAFSMYKDG
jgi:hypothetical protein